MRLGTRKLLGITGVWYRILVICIPLVGVLAILDLFLYFGKSVWLQQYLSLLFGLSTALTFLRIPATKKSLEKLPWYDVALSFCGLVVGIYPSILYPHLIMTVGTLSAAKVILGSIAILLVLESCRRSFGWPLTAIVVFMIFYALCTDIFPGALHSEGVHLDRLIVHLYIDEGALFGVALKVVGTIVLAFIFFGQTLSNRVLSQM